MLPDLGERKIASKIRRGNRDERQPVKHEWTMDWDEL
jgi:hypothetical protein